MKKCLVILNCHGHTFFSFCVNRAELVEWSNHPDTTSSSLLLFIHIPCISDTLEVSNAGVLNDSGVDWRHNDGWCDLLGLTLTALHHHSDPLTHLLYPQLSVGDTGTAKQMTGYCLQFLLQMENIKGTGV